jgi:hypothetical protein
MDTLNGSKSKEIYPEYYDAKVMVELLEDLTIFVFIPVASIIGLILNFLVVRTIKKHQKKDLKEDFYKFMSFNSKFNCLYCLIFAFYPINYCIVRHSK